LIDDLLNAKAVLLDLNRLSYPTHRTSTLGIDFQAKTGKDKERNWEYSEALKPTGNPQALKWPSVNFSSAPPASNRQPSTSPAVLERFRNEGLRHLRLFREVVGEVDPAWWSKHQTELQKMERWLASWKTFEVERWAVVPGEPEKSSGDNREAPPTKTETLTVSLAVDETLARKIKEKLGQPGTCEVSPLTVHFNLGRPYSLADEQGVLPNPEEVEAAARELKRIIETARVKLRFTVRGQTDSSGSKSHNVRLSHRRAQWLLDRLRKHPLGLNLKNARVEGYGESLAPRNPRVSPADRIATILVEPDV
jgi:outer membrane protein OmpA-like peptidoglycan-associated protein